ncbi:hypothetical protein HK101_010692 [Irineochytrium annulatum]|nr:hypothetical protein HK101_010692 [Irineochytrium annulatum]
MGGAPPRVSKPYTPTPRSRRRKTLELHISDVEHDLEYPRDDDYSSIDQDDDYDDNIAAGGDMADIYDMVDAVVPRTDDPTTPALTFRVWVLGIFFASVLAICNTVFLFRTNFYSLNPFIAVLASQPLGVLLHWYLPTTDFVVPYLGEFTLNPGPFTFKEHALLFVFTSTGSRPTYALYNIVGQKFLLGQDISVWWCLVFAITVECFGYALSGIYRRFLVRPAAMLWPGNLSTVALLRSLHDSNRALNVDGDEDLSPSARMKFFWFATLGMTIYQFFPSYIAPALGAVSLLCYVAPNNQRLKMLGSARQGLGLGSLTFDWSIITSMSPITTPLWALLNQYVGLWITVWLIIPFLWYRNAFGADQQIGTNPMDGPNGTGFFPLGQALNSPGLFDRDGSFISPLSLVTIGNGTLVLNETAYDLVAPVRLTTYFAVEYTTYFIVFAATMSHVALWYGRDRWRRLRSDLKDLDRNDIHARLMDAYPDVPNWWYAVLMAFVLTGAIAACKWGGFDLPWWGVLLSFCLAAVAMVPVGTIEAVAGQRIGLNVVAEFMISFILPGRMASVMTFKTFSYAGMFNGLGMVEDLKLGHYVKIPPRSMFAVQVASTVLSAILNVAVAVVVYERIGVDRLNNAPPLGWSANAFTVFLTAGSIWGAIGPRRFLGPGSPYSGCLYGFLIGLLLPPFFYLLHRLFPKWHFHLVNVPLIAYFPTQAGSTRSDLITPFLVGALVNGVVRRWKYGWWRRYAYVMSAAFDTGSGVGILLALLVASGNVNYMINMPFYGLNRFDQESCAPDYYLECNEHMIWGSSFGNTYNISSDTPLCQALFSGELLAGQG